MRRFALSFMLLLVIELSWNVSANAGCYSISWETGNNTEESGNSPPVTGTNNTGDLPDLVMRDVYLEDANQNKVTRLHIKEKGHCHMSVINNGKVKAKGTFENRCWLSVGNQFDGKDKAEDIGKEDMSDLDNGKSRVSHEDFYAPDYPGKRNLVGCTDASSKIKELNEKNNCNLGDQAVLQEYRFEVWSSPNLTTTAISLNGKTSLKVNEPFIISSTTYNAGENFGQDYVYIGYFDNEAPIGQNQILRANMQGGWSKIEELSVPGGIATSGTHEIKACADFINAIAETDETDNCMSVKVNVTDPNAPDPNKFYPCPVITQTNWVSGGWSVRSYSAPFGTDGTILINPSCNKSKPNSLEVTIGNANNPNMVAYMTAYIRDKTTGADMPYPLTCSGLVNNGWCAGTVTLTAENSGINTTSSGDPTLIFGYTCESINGAFQCPPYWQIQGAGLPPQ